MVVIDGKTDRKTDTAGEEFTENEKSRYAGTREAREQVLVDILRQDLSETVLLAKHIPGLLFPGVFAWLKDKAHGCAGRQ